MYILKTSNTLFLIILLGISGDLYSAGARYAEKYPSNAGIDRFFNGKITSIALNDDFYNIYINRDRVINTTVEYLGNGLLFVEDNWSKYFVYNEYFNENILLNFRLNENTTLLRLNKETDYRILFNANSIIIETTIYKLELRFDENTNRLLLFNNERYYDNQLVERFSYYYEYEYDSLGRLEYVYRILNNERILMKSIYYDGIYRIIPRPFFNTMDEIPPDKEIVIYENGKIKYYIKTHPQENDHATSDIIEMEEARRLLLTIEFDVNGNDIRRTLFREKSDYFDEYTESYIIENLEFDHRNNWTKQNVYWSSYLGEQTSNEYSLLNTTTRSISYE